MKLSDLFKKKEKLAMFNPETGAKLSPEEQKQEEQKQHEEVLRRQAVLRGGSGEKMRKELEEHIAETLTPEEQEEAWKKLKERE